VELTAAPPEDAEGELVPLASRQRPGWIWAAPRSGWAKDDLERMAEPLGRLIDIAHEHDRISSRFAESEANPPRRRGEDRVAACDLATTCARR